MRSANLFGPLKGLCPHKALIGLTQASGLAGGFDYQKVFAKKETFSRLNPSITNESGFDGICYCFVVDLPYWLY